MYKGTYLFTISKENVRNPKGLNPILWMTIQAMGKLLPQDVGKKVFVDNGIYQVENEEQMQERIKKEKE